MSVDKFFVAMYLFVNCDSFNKSELKASSKSNNSKAGGGNSWKLGGKTFNQIF